MGFRGRNAGWVGVREKHLGWMLFYAAGLIWCSRGSGEANRMWIAVSLFLVGWMCLSSLKKEETEAVRGRSENQMFSVLMWFMLSCCLYGVCVVKLTAGQRVTQGQFQCKLLVESGPAMTALDFNWGLCFHNWGLLGHGYSSPLPFLIFLECILWFIAALGAKYPILLQFHLSLYLPQITMKCLATAVKNQSSLFHIHGLAMAPGWPPGLD